MASILVVEDDPDLRRLIRYRLERTGHTVEETATGEGALRLTSEKTFDLIILDVRLPGVSGWEVARKLAANPNTVHSQILFASVVEREDAPHDVVVKGWLTKPFAKKDFNRAVEEILDELG